MIKIKAIYLLIAVFFVFSANTAMATADDSVEFVIFDDQTQPTRLKSMELISVDDCETVTYIAKGDFIEFFKFDNQVQPVKLKIMKSIPTDGYEVVTYSETDGSVKFIWSGDMTQAAKTQPAEFQSAKFQSIKLTAFNPEKMNEPFEKKQIEWINGEMPTEITVAFAEIAD